MHLESCIIYSDKTKFGNLTTSNFNVNFVTCQNKLCTPKFVNNQLFAAIEQLTLDLVVVKHLKKN